MVENRSSKNSFLFGLSSISYNWNKKEKIIVFESTHSKKEDDNLSGSSDNNNVVGNVRLIVVKGWIETEQQAIVKCLCDVTGKKRRA